MTPSARSRSESRDRGGHVFAGTSGGGGGGGGGAVTGPAGVTGLLMWLRAKDLGANGTTVSTWTDQVGHASPTLAGTGTDVLVATGATPSGGKAARFAGGKWLTLFEPNPTTFSSVAANSTVGGFSTTALSDADPSTDWAGGANDRTAVITVTPSTAGTIATSYRLTASGATNYQNPSAWTFQGLNDGTAWTTLDTRTGQGSWVPEARTYSFTNTTAYSQYRWNITNTNGGADGYVRISGLAVNTVAGYGSGAAEAWVVVKNAGAGTNGLWEFGLTGDSFGQNYPYSGDGNIYEVFGRRGAARQIVSPVVSLTSWRLYRVANNGTTWQAWLDNVSRATSSAVQVGWTSTPRLGADRFGNGPTTYTGDVAELLLLDHVSTSGDVTALISYFNTEHGLTVT